MSFEGKTEPRQDGRWTIRHLIEHLSQIKPEIEPPGSYERWLSDLDTEQPGLGELYDQILAAFSYHDPIHLVGPDNPDEYWPVAKAAIPRFHEVSSAEELARMLKQVFEEVCGTPGDETTWQPMAHDVWQVWQEWQRTHAAPSS